MSSNSNACYSDDRPNVGLVDLISTVDGRCPETQKDLTNITHAFRWMGMTVNRPFLDLYRDDFQSTICQILNPTRDLSAYNLFIMVLICDLREGDMVLRHEHEHCLSVAEILSKLGNLETMMKRPKVLLIESTSGTSLTFSFRNALLSGPNSVVPDVLLAYSSLSTLATSPEDRCKESGSFLTALSDKIIEVGDTEHLAGLLTLVNVRPGNVLPMVESTSTLGKKVYFQTEKTFKLEMETGEGVKARTYGDPNGTGFIVFANKHFFKGSLINGFPRFEGNCIYEWPSGNVREVEFDEGSSGWDNFSGKGESFNIREGWKYVGKFKDGKAHGSGIYYFEDGRIFIGNYDNGDPTGYGCVVPAGFQNDKSCDIMILLNE